MFVLAILSGLLVVWLLARKLRRRARRREYWLTQAEIAIYRANVLSRNNAFEESFAMHMFAGTCVDKANEAESTPFWRNAP